MLEGTYQSRLVKRLKKEFPGIVILKNDTSPGTGIQGFPDLTLLYYLYWAVLEVKIEPPTGPDDFEPNQEWYIETLNDLAYATCIFPENEDEVIRELQQTFHTQR